MKILLNLNKTIGFIIALVKDCYQFFPGSFFLETVPYEETHRGCSIIMSRIGSGWVSALFVMLRDGKQWGMGGRGGVLDERP